MIMKTVSISEASNHLSELLSSSESIALTDEKNSDPTWILVPVRQSDMPRAHTVGQFTLIVMREADLMPLVLNFNSDSNTLVEKGTSAVGPSFGRGRGMLTVLAEDDDHLSDFQEYMQ